MYQKKLSNIIIYPYMPSIFFVEYAKLQVQTIALVLKGLSGLFNETLKCIRF